jgi:protein O-GlcNAc transferase
MPDVADRVLFLPRLAFHDYLSFLPLADVLLDTIHFSGGTTALHAFAAGVPLVTLPGRFARGRDAYEIYMRLGIDACTATDKEDYVRRAVRIAGDRDLRQSIASSIRERSGVLFSNPSACHEIEAFFVESALSQGHRSP